MLRVWRWWMSEEHKDATEEWIDGWAPPSIPTFHGPVFEPLTKKGWICPVCGTGMAPWMSRCRCVAQEITNGTGSR
jgi:hypothetical protein